MFELFIILAILVALSIVIGFGALTPEVVLMIGVAMIALAMLAGLPASIVYHVKLRRTLASRGTIPRRWWLHPMQFHPQLSAIDRGPVLRWFGVGVAAAMLALGGCGVVLVSLLRLR